MDWIETRTKRIPTRLPSQRYAPRTSERITDESEVPMSAFSRTQAIEAFCRSMRSRIGSPPLWDMQSLAKA
jgi:hypothetical protein